MARISNITASNSTSSSTEKARFFINVSFVENSTEEECKKFTLKSAISKREKVTAKSSARKAEQLVENLAWDEFDDMTPGEEDERCLLTQEELLEFLEEMGLKLEVWINRAEQTVSQPETDSSDNPLAKILAKRNK